MSLRSPRSAPRPRSALPDRNRHSSHSSSQGTFSSASFRPADEWRTRPSILIKVSDLPSDISTEHIWQWFKSSGNIVWIDVLEPNNRHGKSAARIRFEPPPRRTLWALGPMTVQHPDPDKYPAGLRLRISLWDEKPSSGSKLTYPEKVLLNLNSLAFGSMLNPTLMRVMKSISSASSRTLLLEFDTKRGNMSIFFSTGSQTDVAADWESPRQWKVTFQLSNIKKILESVGHDGSRHWVFSLPYPPQYFGKVDKILGTLQCNPQRWSTNDTWYRATDIDAKNNQLSTGPISLHNEVRNSGQVDIGRWTTFRLSFDSREAGNKVSYPHFTSALSLSNPSVPIHPGCDFDNQAGAPNLWDYLEHPSVVHGFQPSALLEMPPKILLPFQVRYQLEVCVSRGLMNEYTIGIDFLEKLASLQERDATLRLEYLVDQNEKLVDPMSLFQMQDAEVYAPTTKVPHYCTYVRKASITPTTIRFNSPTVETSNRVVRKYSHIQDRFLRVQFLEECESYRVGKNQQINDQVWKRVERTLFQGIRIGDRYYEFLAFGSSQLRQCSAYFFCPTDHLSCDDIRAWMGQFDHIKCAAKYGARLGQCFSTTRDIKGVVIPHIRQVDDIMRNGQCFTDGVGLISEFLSKLIMGEMTLDVFDKPTAFQFRMGGCKGVLAVWPQAKGMEVHVRPSQEKFKSDFRGLEIVRCAARSTATLNRQTIPLLECLGVPRQVFLKLLKDQINWFENAKHDNSVAIELLTKFVDENQSSLILAELLKAGFKTDGNQEPFALNIFNLWVSWSFSLLRAKARIHVPKSAFVLGCVDESGTLRGHSIDTEGSAVKDEDQLPQIFLQLTDPNHNGQTEIIKGVCIVGRNPSLHPGDIRVVQAVDAPELRHLKDVVVFSSKGDKPVPSMLSGGDLDGDDFFIIWDAGLIPTEWNHRPMCYEAPAPKQLNRDVVVDDLRKFFVNFMKNDVLALIAVSHLALADKHGPKSAICTKLAELHSQAVDYAKTGEPALFSSKMKPKLWPHFMDKLPDYRSNKVLGAIYDEVKKHPFEFHPNWEHSFDKRVLERYELDNDILAAARVVKAQYDAAVHRLLVQYKLETEFELYTGWTMSKTNVANDYKMQEDLGREFDVLKQRFREQCCNIAGGSEAPQLDKFVAAMYKVTEEEVKKALSGGTDEDVETESTNSQESSPRMPFISFPWIFHWVMIRLAMGDKYKPGKSVLAAARRVLLFNPSLLEAQPPPHGIRIPPAPMPFDSQTTSGDMAHQSNLSIPEQTKESLDKQGNEARRIGSMQQPDASTHTNAENAVQDEIPENIYNCVSMGNSLVDEAAAYQLEALLGAEDDD